MAIANAIISKSHEYPCDITVSMATALVEIYVYNYGNEEGASQLALGNNCTRGKCIVANTVYD